MYINILRLLKEKVSIFYLDLLTNSALLPLVPRVDVEFDCILGYILKDLHQTAENLRFQLTNEAASQQARPTSRCTARVLGFRFRGIWSNLRGRINLSP